MKRWRLVLLGFELALFALILVLPQVDLPDFTFSGGTAPVAVHSRLCCSPLHIVAAVATLIPPLPQMTEALAEILRMYCDARSNAPFAGNHPVVTAFQRLAQMLQLAAPVSAHVGLGGVLPNHALRRRADGERQVVFDNNDKPS